MNDNRPNKIGNFTVLHEIGKGASGVAYLAEHAQTGEKVTIKAASVNTPDIVKRLERETHAISQLSHANITRIVDAGVSDDGRFYVATAWVDGKALRTIMDAHGRLGHPEICQVIESVAKALACAHPKGIIHRDIKPANIVIPVDDTGHRFDQAKLIDFSLVGIVEPGTHTTPSGEILGTPIYMSPEQIRGERQSPAIDVYSVGIVAYEMAYGRIPFRQRNLAGLFAEIVRGDIAFPEDPSVSPDLEALIRQCIAPDPKKRITSGEALLQAVRRLYDSGTKRAAPESPLPMPQRPETAAPMPVGKRALGPLPLLTIIAVLIVLFLAYCFMLKPAGPPSGASDLPLNFVAMLAFSVLLIPTSILAGVRLGRFIRRQKPLAQTRAEHILTGTSGREALTRSIAIEIDSLFESLKRFDEKILAESLALMLDEYDDATASDDRQRALMNAVTILDKLTQRLSPWYVRHEKAVAFVVSAVGIISGVATATATIMKMISR